METGPMRFIQAGVGGFGRNWAKTLRGSPDVEVVALVDPSEAALEACCREHGFDSGIRFRSLADALGRVRADALVCVAPPEHHRAVATTAMEAGLDVITEKPMAASLADCRAMMESALATGRTCAVSQNYRYNPDAWTAADLVRRGEVGAVGQTWVDFCRGVDFGGGFRHQMDFPLLVDMAIHHFDLLRFITGLDAVAVSGRAWNPPWSNYRGDSSSSVVFELSDGSRAVYNASWASKGQHSDWNGNWLVEGSSGAFSWRAGHIEFCRAPQLYAETGRSEVKPSAPPSTGQAFVLADFVEAVRTGRRPRTDLADNINSIAMVFAAVEAVRSGRSVPVLDDATRELAGKLADRKNLARKEKP